MKEYESNSIDKLSNEEAETLKSLLNYPSLERIFDANDANNLKSIKQKMRSTIEDLERVIRRGAKTDAARATIAVEAIQTTLKFLDEIERARQSKIR